ncbi:hypothetical protein JW964_09810 [candidate division KSB1 bacterium]|nr:hypothetical protein [candidate division KSB1 bacterium]
MPKIQPSSLTIFCFTFIFLNALSTTSSPSAEKKINRKALVTRHHPHVSAPDKLSPFSVGNGEFAFTADFTGIQTFSDFYDETGIPLGTQSQWGWHTIPDKNNYFLEQTYKPYNTYGRSVNYASETNNPAAQWLRANPHRLHLGQIGFRIMKNDSESIQISDVSDIHQTLNLWEGIIKSQFKISKKKVQVETCCHPTVDQIAVKVKSKLLQEKKVDIAFNFPYGSTSWGKRADNWQTPEKHETIIIRETTNSVTLERKLDADKYYVEIKWIGEAKFGCQEKHHYLLSPGDTDEFQFTCHFSPELIEASSPSCGMTFHNSRSHWQNFWETGGAIDFTGSKDPRAKELERRIVLSQYLMAIQCAGSLPPQETGLTCNSWYGKFHLEMHWWHGVHFPLWGRAKLFEKSLDWYRKILRSAKINAIKQGYAGARWPKMVGPDGRESPSSVGVFLIWQQPHPIYYAELLYQIKKEPSLIQKYRQIVFETAEFMASYSVWDKVNKRYVLGPPLIPAQEIYKPESTLNPPFELAYWNYGLQIAQQWRERSGISRNEKWDHIIQNLSKLPEQNGLYQNAENALNTFEDASHRNDHPTLLGTFGMLPNPAINKETMRQTLKKVMETWNWERTWGWDYPLTAMTAARVGEPELAIDALLMNVPKNRFLNNGHNHQDDRLTLYLPGNGGLLTAIAMMAAGWDGAPDIPAPGFPKNGKWVVKWEGLYPLP